jgi:hypothetical protein
MALLLGPESLPVTRRAVEFHGGPKDGECIFIDEEVRIVNIPILTGDRPIAGYHKVEQEVEVTMLSIPVNVTVIAMRVEADMILWRER